MSTAIEGIQSLVKALEAGGYNAAPSTLVQGASLQVEDLSPVMELVTYDDSHIKLQKMLKVDSCKSTLAQFDRQLSYGVFGGSAQLEGQVGQEETSDYVRITVPMCYYSEVRRVTLVANMVATVDGKKADEREAANAARRLAGDIEFDLFRGKSDFSNAGVFDGNPLVMAALPNILGLDAQVRQSDNQRNARDLMFSEYGSDDSVVIPGGSTLSQENIEDAHVRSQLNMGYADRLMVDPKVLSNYNKLAFGGAGASGNSSTSLQRIVLAGSAQDASGSDLRKQWVSGGTVSIEASRFLSGKAKPAQPRSNGPLPPTATSAADGTALGTSFVSGQKYWYASSSVNEVGESGLTFDTAQFTVATTGHSTVVSITNPAGTVRYFNMYRTFAGGAKTATKFIGRVLADPSGVTTFVDLNNKTPGFVTGFLVQGDTMSIKELAPYSRLKLAVTDLSNPEAHFRFATLAVTQPRKNVLIDNLH